MEDSGCTKNYQRVAPAPGFATMYAGLLGAQALEQLAL